MKTKESQKTFSELISGDKPVLVDFFAEWCGPCKMMKPILHELKEMIGDKAIILKIDVDKSSSVASNYHVQAVPTLIVFKKGKIVWRQSGVVRADPLQRILLQYQE
jgi:thioredoxin 1